MNIAQFIEKYNLGFKIEPIATRPDQTDEHRWAACCRDFKCKLSYNKKSMTIYFSQGTAYTKPPTVLDVLSCIHMDMTSFENSNSFESWAEDFGFDSDSRIAERTYNEIAKQRKNLVRVFGNIYQEFIDCENDY